MESLLQWGEDVGEVGLVQEDVLHGLGTWECCDRKEGTREPCAV